MRLNRTVIGNVNYYRQVDYMDWKGHLPFYVAKEGGQ